MCKNRRIKRTFASTWRARALLQFSIASTLLKTTLFIHLKSDGFKWQHVHKYTYSPRSLSLSPYLFVSISHFTHFHRNRNDFQKRWQWKHQRGATQWHPWYGGCGCDSGSKHLKRLSFFVVNFFLFHLNVVSFCSHFLCVTNAMSFTMSLLL